MPMDFFCSRMIAAFLFLPLFAFASVDMRTGAYSKTSVDFVLSKATGMAWERSYLSNIPVDGILGNGWTHSYQFRAFYIEPGLIQITSPFQETLMISEKNTEFRTLEGRVLALSKLEKNPKDREQLISSLMKSDQLFDTFWQKYLIEHRKSLSSAVNGLVTDRFTSAVPSEGTASIRSGRIFWTQSTGVTLEFDGDGRIATVHSQSANLVFHWKNNQLDTLHVEDVSKRVFRFEYDRQRISSIFQDGNKNPMVKYSYNSQGDLVSVLDANGARWDYQYHDKTRALIGVRLNNKLIESIEYASHSKFAPIRALQVLDQEKNEYSFDRSKVNSGIYATNVVRTLVGSKKKLTEHHEWLLHRSAEKDPYILRETHSGAAGAITIFRNSTGQPVLEKFGKDKIAYQYDGLGRLTGKITRRNLLSLTYNRDGSIRRILSLNPRESKPAESSEFEYDSYGRMSGFKTGDGAGARFTRDSVGRIVAMTDLKSKVSLNLEFDPKNRVTVITSKDLGSYQFKYDSNGEMVSHQRPSNLAKAARIELWWERFSAVLALGLKGGI